MIISGLRRVGLFPVEPLACVMGNLDLVRPLGLAGIRCASVARTEHPVHFSRFVDERIELDRPGLVERLLRLAAAKSEPPVLFFQSDADLDLVSAHRERLAQAYRFLLPPAELLRQLLDKERFAALGERLGLPVPRTRVLTPMAEDSGPDDLGIDFPLVIKPLPHRDGRWHRLVSPGKVLRVDSPAALRTVWPRLRAAGKRFLAQELVPGPERRVESYHVYVGGDRRIVGEFAGRKLRTLPLDFGRSTAVETTDDPSVLATGRMVVERLRLTGVAKLDFKRDSEGRLRLLEVNPRYTLWAHIGALAGVNLPALSYADLTGVRRPAPARARPGVSWSWPRRDGAAARALGMRWSSWLRWTAGSDVKTNLSWDDPMPFVRGWLWPKLRAPARRGAGRS